MQFHTPSHSIPPLDSLLIKWEVGHQQHPGTENQDSQHMLTRYATTHNPKAGLGLQRWSARRQPVAQAQIIVVQGLLCGNSSEKVPYHREKKKPWRTGEKVAKIQLLLFPALRLGVVLYLLTC